jgi:hypothetical protein
MPQTLKRVQADAQVEIRGMKFVDKERTNKLFRDEPTDPPEFDQPTEVRRNHFPPGPIIDEPGKKKIYTTMRASVVDKVVLEPEPQPKPEDRILGQSKKVGNKYRLDDN